MTDVGIQSLASGCSNLTTLNLIWCDEITDVGMVTSTHDVVTELTISFFAQDYKPMSKFNLQTGSFTPTQLYDDRSSVLHQKLFGSSTNPAVREFVREQDRAKEGLIAAGLAAGLTREQIENDLVAAGLGPYGGY